jgi:hypothetical protein
VHLRLYERLTDARLAAIRRPCITITQPTRLDGSVPRKGKGTVIRFRLSDKNVADRHLAVLYENDDWLTDFFSALGQRDVPYAAFRMDDAAVLLDAPPTFPVVFNRTSPSSYLRGHGPAISYARTLLDILAAHGVRIVNGGAAFRTETSKVAQLLLLRRLGVATPRTVVFNGRGRILERARGFPFPGILKPDCGGSGAFMRRVESYDHLLALLDRERELFGPDHVLLLSEAIAPGNHTVVRTEFVDGELVYAMRVHAVNTFNLCPAPGCEREAADPGSTHRPHVEFEPYPAIAPDAVAQAREIVRSASLDVGGVEYVESADGTRWYIDINATSVYRPEICEALGVDALAMLVDFLEREYRKELVKRTGPRMTIVET